MALFSSELSGSLLFNSASIQAALEPFSGGLNVSGSELYINGVGLDTRIANIEAGSVGSASLGPLNTHSQSVNDFTASIETFTGSTNTSLTALNTFTSSLNIRVTTLENNDDSYLTLATLPNGLVSSSVQISSSGFLTSASAAEIGFGEGSGTPAGTISSSQQIADLGYITSSNIDSASYSDTAVTASYINASNIDGTVVSSSFAITASYINPDFISQSAAAAGFSDAELPAGTISSSQQISDLGYITSSGGGITDTGSFAVTSSNTFTGSQFFSGSLIPEALSSENGIHDLGSLSKPWRDLYITTGSVNFVRDGQLVSTVTGERNAIRVGNILITTSSISVVQGSGDNLTNIQTVVEANVSSSGEVTETTQVTAPDGTVSSSAQIDGLGFVSSSRYNLDSASFDTRIDNISAGAAPAGTISSSAQVSQSAASEGFSTSYDGNRIVSSEYFPGLTGSVNLGTSGSIQNFLDALFFPNTAPTFTTTANQNVTEFATSGSTLLTLSATDAEGQAVTFSTGSGYTDDFLRVASDGTVTFNVVPTAENFNTDDRGDGTLAHPIDIVVTDAFGTSTTQTFYFNVSANSAPVFRQTSVAGSIITSFTVSRNENATAGEVGKIYFTDANSDTITIESSSIPSEFSVTKYGTYVQINQETGSLDYETTPTFQFSITASDEHYQAGQDLEASASIPITINVVDNEVPVVNDQVLGSINENSSNGATVGTIAASDNEGDTITFRNFTLSSLQLDGVNVATGSYGGTAQLTDPHEDPFQMSNTGTVTRKSGVYLNSDLVNRYIYSVEVVDSFNTASDAGLITINITDDTPATLSDNWSAGPYIIESAIANDNIVTISGGSTQADLNANQSGTWTSSNAAILIDGNGRLSIGNNISGSTTSSGDTISSTITFSNTFKTTTTANLNVSVTTNSSPTATFTNQSGIFNTNQATQNSNLVSISISDTESDTPYQLTLGGAQAASFNTVPQNAASSSWQLQAASDLAAGTYNYEVAVTDNFGKSTSYTGRSVTIAQADLGTLATNGTFYIIESAENTALIRTNSNGRTGTQGRVTVSYSPNYGSQAVQSFTSSNALVDIDSSGYLTVGTDISGSGNNDGDVISSTITWRDQYDNIDSSSININVTENLAPTVSSTTVTNNNTNQARNTNQILQLSVTDTESDTIPNSGLVFSGYNSTYFTPSISTPNMRLLVNSVNVPEGTYPYTASLTDEHGFSTNTVSGSFSISAADTGTLGGDTSIYSIESATNGTAYRDATGYNNGNAAQVTVSYSPSYGSPAVESFTSSNAAIAIDNSGNLTLGIDLSGSATQSGDTITSTITFRDQYDNIGSGSVTATIFGNQSPSANFTAASDYNTDAAISGSTAGTLTVSDTESDTPFTVTLGGTDGGKFDVVGSSSPFTIQPTGSLGAGTYTLNITVTDDYNESTTLTGETITVTQAADYGKFYIYTSTRTGGGTLSSANYNGIMGISTVNSDTPPEITGFTADTTSPVQRFKSGYLSSSSISVGGGTMTLRATASGSSPSQSLLDIGSFSGNGSTAEQILFIYPSGSDLAGVPTSIVESFGGSDAGDYVLNVNDAGSFSNTISGGRLNLLELDAAHEGYDHWFIIGRTGTNTASTFEARLTAESGSAPT